MYINNCMFECCNHLFNICTHSQNITCILFLLVYIDWADLSKPLCFLFCYSLCSLSSNQKLENHKKHSVVVYVTIILLTSFYLFPIISTFFWYSRFRGISKIPLAIRPNCKKYTVNLLLLTTIETDVFYQIILFRELTYWFLRQ